MFLDYGTLIPTGTLNYKDALGIAEKYHRSVSGEVFSNYVGDEHGVLFPFCRGHQRFSNKQWN